MRFDVEQSPNGAWCVRAPGYGRPLARHDTEDEAREHAEQLADGAELLVRPVAPVDRCLFVTGWNQLTPESRESRFLFAKGGLSDKELDFFTQVDHDDHEAIGAIDPETGQGVGVARMLRNPDDPTLAEAAVVVLDDWQGRGVGGLLLSRLLERAKELGIRGFEATLRTGNRAMLTLFQRMGRMRVTERYGDTTGIVVELPVHDDDGVLAAALRSAAAGTLEAVGKSDA
jgi:GNAT superfamily N-acetyltransferase